MKNIRVLAFLVLGFCSYAAPILAAVNCQCYASYGCGPTPPNCLKREKNSSTECKQFCTNLCNTPPEDPSPERMTALETSYDSGCCSYTKKLTNTSQMVVGRV